MIEVAKTLPVNHLSKSSISLYLRCPEKFRRRYIERETEPIGVPMMLGGAIGAAESRNFQEKITSGVDLPLADVLDFYDGEWSERVNMEEVDWAGVKPGAAKDQGVALTTCYHTTAAPDVRPISVERKLSFKLADAEWDVVGYIDWETVDGAVVDLKVKGKSFTTQEIQTEMDPTLYLAARRAEGNPASRFDFHVLKKTKEPGVEINAAQRTDRQLDRFLQRVALISQEIAWRTETGNWSGAAPGSWWCSQKSCGFWSTCRYGGG